MCSLRRCTFFYKALGQCRTLINIVCAYGCPIVIPESGTRALETETHMYPDVDHYDTKYVSSGTTYAMHANFQHTPIRLLF